MQRKAAIGCNRALSQRAATVRPYCSRNAAHGRNQASYCSARRMPTSKKSPMSGYRGWPRGSCRPTVTRGQTKAESVKKATMQWSNQAVVKPSNGQTCRPTRTGYAPCSTPSSPAPRSGAVRRSSSASATSSSSNTWRSNSSQAASSLINKTRRTSRAPATSRSGSFCLAVQNRRSPFRRQMDAEPCHALLHHDLGIRGLSCVER